MFYIRDTNTYTNGFSSFEINGIQYPDNWIRTSNKEQLEEMGIFEVTATNTPKDDRYYYVSTEYNGKNLTYINVPKNIDMLKTNLLYQVDASAYSLLQPTDYKIIKAVEQNTAVDPKLSEWRQLVRTRATELKAQINDAQDVETLEAISLNNWPTM